MAHGEFGDWLESIEIDRTLATRMMRIVDELGDAKYATWHNLSQRVLYEIATLPPKDRTRGHMLSSGATKTPDEMNVRELREVKATLKVEREARGRKRRPAHRKRRTTTMLSAIHLCTI